MRDKSARAWVLGDKPIFQSKSKEARIMVSEFVEQHNVFLKIPEFQAQHVDIPSTARVLLECGAEMKGTGIASDSSANSRIQ